MYVKKNPYFSASLTRFITRVILKFSKIISCNFFLFFFINSFWSLIFEEPQRNDFRFSNAADTIDWQIDNNCNNNSVVLYRKIVYFFVLYLLCSYINWIYYDVISITSAYKLRFMIFSLPTNILKTSKTSGPPCACVGQTT